MSYFRSKSSARRQLGIGAYSSSVIVIGSAVSLTTATPANLTSLALTAGDWDVGVFAIFVGNAATGNTQFAASLSTASATLQLPNATFNNSASFSLGSTAATAHVPQIRVTISSATTYYAVIRALFTGGAVSAYGELYARRAI